MKNWREFLIIFLVFCFALVLGIRLFFLQIVRGEYFRALAFGLRGQIEENTKERGEIFFKDGEPLALNRDYFFVFVLGEKLKDEQKTAEILSQILNLEKNFVLEKLKNKTSYSVIKRKLTLEEVEKIKKAKLEGVFLGIERVRYYPQKNLASNVVGFVNTQKKGQYGLEKYFDEILSEGNDLVLTLDYKIQLEAEKLLDKAKKDFDIEGGQIVVMEPDSGKILAMANFPNFDPNSYQNFADNLEIFKNGVTQKLFEPGSTFKPITMAAGLNEGKITPETTYVDTGKVEVGGYVIRNYDNRIWGKQTMTGVLEKSINTGAVFVEKLLPHHVFLDYIARFGIFEPTEIDLPEIYSENKEFKKGYEVNFATASFGQGIEMTPIQLARAICAIANGGKLVRPYLVEKIIKDGKEIKIEPKIQKESIIAKETALQLTKMLVSTVENGFAKRAKIPGYFVAGKTGTAQIPFPSLGIKKSGYSDKTWQTFVGFAPAFNPKFLVLVKLDNPKTRAAASSAVVLAQTLMKFIINYYQIPPDYEEKITWENF